MTNLKYCTDILKKEEVGSKAYNLKLLMEANFLVPEFYVLPMNQKIKIEDLDTIKYKRMSIRSGSLDSYPGLMQSFLNVSKDDLFDYIKKVKKSWNSDLMIQIRNHLNRKDYGTAVIIQKMVNKEDIIFSGTCSNYCPISHKKELQLNYIMKDYGDKVVLGLKKDSNLDDKYIQEMKTNIEKVDNFFEKPQEIEFCYTSHGCYLLQSRDIVFKQKNNDQEITGKSIGTGLGSHDGVVSGYASFDECLTDDILCTVELNPCDLPDLLKAKAVLSKKGDHNSHIAILCRLLNKPYILSAILSKKLEDRELIHLNTNNGNIYID